MPAHRFELLRRRLPCDVSAPQLAREALKPLSELASVREDALLLTSELVTNAVLHSGCAPADEVEVVAELTPEAVIIAVTDAGRSGRTPTTAQQPRREPGGHGLRLIDALALRWGTEENGGRRVWAEVALAA
jgi:anti-sigma regulatory factor (Ser/Thr protein kinase)